MDEVGKHVRSLDCSSPRNMMDQFGDILLMDGSADLVDLMDARRLHKSLNDLEQMCKHGVCSSF